MIDTMNSKDIYVHIKWKRLKEHAIMPKKATDGSAAYDALIPTTT